MIFQKLLNKYIGAPYRLGGNGPDGFDCYGFVWRFAREQYGVELPTAMDGVTIDTYGDLIRRDKKAAEALMIRAIGSVGDEVHLDDVAAGDLVVVHHEDGSYFPAIYGGGRKVISSFRRVGVRPIELTGQNYVVLARRLKPL